MFTFNCSLQQNAAQNSSKTFSPKGSSSRSLEFSCLVTYLCRGLPTFHVYKNSNRVYEFTGANQVLLRQLLTANAATMPGPLATPTPAAAAPPPASRPVVATPRSNDLAREHALLKASFIECRHCVSPVQSLRLLFLQSALSLHSASCFTNLRISPSFDGHHCRSVQPRVLCSSISVLVMFKRGGCSEDCHFLLGLHFFCPNPILNSTSDYCKLVLHVLKIAISLQIMFCSKKC